MKKITAVIPVRKGSQRIRNKNIKKFSDSNLLKIKIEQLKKIKSIDRVVVSSDCKDMLKIASDSGVETHVREKYYASSAATNSEFFHNLALSINSEHLMYSPVTCPLVSRETYLECIEKYQQSENVVTVAPVKHHLWLDGKPLNYNIEESPNSQDLPDIYQITYGVCIISRENMIKFKNIVTSNPTFKVLNEIESLDIDTEFDFLLAEMIYDKLRLK
jgi:CMP-N-acetylneuraminic acid synthetase|tara:strand:- start:137 stop:787 length:651 start_codon:yes stop_codon:yes gene_type:complete